MATTKKDIYDPLNDPSQNKTTEATNGNTTSADATKVNYPDNFSYDKFSYDNYQSSGKVDEAIGNGFSYGDFSYANYAPSETVQQAQAALQAIQAAQPGAYQSQWQDQINGIIDRILNREQFSYDVNSDALYQQYADQYTRLGKIAMQDTMGQAAAMTGGYGNSYAAAVGNQAYQNYLAQLNDKVPELYKLALDKYNMDGQEMYNQYGLLNAQEQQDYGRYQDSYNKWLAERDYATGRYDTESDRDYNRYNTDRSFAYNQYSDDKSYAYNDYLNAIENAKWAETEAYNQYLNDRNFAYGAYSDDRNLAYDEYLNEIQKAQWEASFDETVRQNDISNEQWSENMAFNKEQAAIGNEQWQQSFDETVRQNDIGNSQWQQSFDEGVKQNAIGNEQWEKSFAEQQNQNAIGNQQWQQSFDESVKQNEIGNDQWQQSFDEQQKQNAIGNSQWDKSFAEQQKQNAIGNSQWQQSFDANEEQRGIDNEYRETARQDAIDSENRAYAREDVLAIIANGGTPDSKMLKTAGLTKAAAEAMAVVSSGDQKAALEHVSSMSSAELVETMKGYNDAGDNAGLAAFLDDCEASRRLTPEQADAYYEKYRKENGHTITDTTVATPSGSSSTGSGGRGFSGISTKY